MIRQLPDQIMITETLSATIPKAFGTASLLISDSALKVVFSYYPVCRCQRTSRSRAFADKKTQSRIRLELGSAAPLAFADAAPIDHVGTKLSSNLQSPNVRRTLSKLEESRFQRDQ